MVAAQVLAKYATEAEALGRLNHYGCSRAVLTGCKGLHWVGSCSMADTSQMPQMGGCMVVLGAVNRGFWAACPTRPKTLRWLQYLSGLLNPLLH